MIYLVHLWGKKGEYLAILKKSKVKDKGKEIFELEV